MNFSDSGTAWGGDGGGGERRFAAGGRVVIQCAAPPLWVEGSVSTV
jgi:hypothetical protein